MAELATDYDITEVIISIDDDFNFILQAIKSRRNEIFKQDGYFERVVSLYNHDAYAYAYASKFLIIFYWLI